MKIAFRHYIKKSEEKICKDARDSSRAVIWVITIVITHFAVLKYFLYSLCPSVLFTGYPCPACGMTRAGILLLTGHYKEAAFVHPFIYPLVILLVIFFIYRYLFLKDSLKWMKISLACLGDCMILFYIYRMIRYFPDTSPMLYYKYNLLYLLKALIGKIVF